MKKIYLYCLFTIVLLVCVPYLVIVFLTLPGKIEEKIAQDSADPCSEITDAESVLSTGRKLVADTPSTKYFKVGRYGIHTTIQDRSIYMDPGDNVTVIKDEGTRETGNSEDYIVTVSNANWTYIKSITRFFDMQKFRGDTEKEIGETGGEIVIEKEEIREALLSGQKLCHVYVEGMQDDSKVEEHKNIYTDLVSIERYKLKD